MQGMVKTVMIYIVAAVGLVILSAVAYGVFTASSPLVGAILSAIFMPIVGYGVGLVVRKTTAEGKQPSGKNN